MSAWWLNELDMYYDALIMANGTPPGKVIFAKLRQRCGTVVALDGGVNVLKRWKSVPDRVIGDLDSMTFEAFAWATKHDARVHPRPSQDSSDFDKGLKLCQQNEWKRVLIVAADGDRLDHVLNNLTVAATARNLSITIMTRRALMFVLKGKTRRAFEVPVNHAISWFGLPEAGPCSLSGVMWPIRNRKLKFGGMNSLSNLSSGGTVKLSQSGGVSLFVLNFKPKPAKSLLFKR